MKAGLAMLTAVVALAGTPDDADEELPSEFRIFASGWNDSTKGRVLFDKKAASSVLAAYKKHGVDLMIDLEHLSLEPDAKNYDPDARGWCKLEVREGELWAVDVTWTDDGQARVKGKRQRYVSPAFLYDEKTKRVKDVVNVAITSLPATHDMPALVAARRDLTDLRAHAGGPSLQDVARALQAALDDRHPRDPEGPWVSGPYACDVYDASVVYEFDGKLYEAPYSFDGSAAVLGAGVEVRRSYEPIQPAAETAARRLLSAIGGAMDPEMLKKALDAIEAGDSNAALEILKGLIAQAAGGDAAPVDPPADDPDAALADDPPVEEDEEDMVATAAAASRLLTLTAKATLGAAVAEVETWRQSHLNADAERAKLDRDRAALEATERRSLVASLVKLGVELPATAWKDSTAKVPCKRLLAEPIAELRARVATFARARPGVLTSGATTSGVVPPAGGTDAHGLTPEQLKICAETGCKPEVFAALRRTHTPAHARSV